MISDLDESLEKLIETGLPPSIVEQVSISFTTPDQDFENSTSLPAIDMFLYDLRENRELRSNECHIDRTSEGKVTKRPPPARVDCSYLVTAWAAKSSTTPARYEHYLLGEVMRVLLRHPTLPAEILQGALAGQEPPLPTVTVHSGRLQSPGEFWQALGGKLKAAFHYTVTVGVQLQELEELGPAVIDEVSHLGQITEDA